MTDCFQGPIFPTPCDVRTALSYFLDLNHAPSKTTLSKLALFARDEEKRKRLRFLSGKEGKKEFGAMFHEDKTSLFRVVGVGKLTSSLIMQTS